VVWKRWIPLEKYVLPHGLARLDEVRVLSRLDR